MVLRAGGAGASFGFARVLKQRIRIPGLIVLVWIIVIASIDTLGFVAYDLASISAGPALPLVVTISGLFGAITLVLARFFYKQKLERVQVAGIALLLFGVVLLLYFLNH